MKRYIIFAWDADDRYGAWSDCHGGWSDYIGNADSIEKGYKIILKETNPVPSLVWQIVDTQTEKVVDSHGL